MTAKHILGEVSRPQGIAASFHHDQPLGRSKHTQFVYATQPLPWVVREQRRRHNKIARASRKQNR